MSDEKTNDRAEPSPASDGSVTAEPVAWLVAGDGYEYATLLKEHAEVIAEEEDGVVVSLYRQPQPTLHLKPILTKAEREAITSGIYLCEGEAGEANENVNANAWAKTAGVLRGLLERLR